MQQASPRSALLLLIALVLDAGVARAVFHDGGVANCGGCHVSHASEDGLAVDVDASLLRGDSASDTCLLCHSAGAWAVIGPSVFAPTPELGAGDFAYLLEDELNDAVTAVGPSRGGERAGHNVVAPGSGLVPDPRSPTAPGGTFPSAALGCTSCHDPHGNAAFRMLHGVGLVQEGIGSFIHPAPDGEGIDASVTNWPEGRGAHTAYRSGWSDWCGNCHTDVHGPGAAFEHPIDAPLGAAIAARYNAYEGDAALVPGDPATSYVPQVPFADPSVTAHSTMGPTASSRVDCMSCHRAHASSAPASGRWDFRVPTMGDDGVASGSLALPNPFGDPGQRQLCVKCHDTGGHDNGHSCHQCHGSGAGGGGRADLPLIDQQ